MELLYYLSDRTDCDYLSDLKLSCFRPAVRRVLETVRAKDFPMRQWEDAADYLLGVKRPFQNEDDALAYILRLL